MLPVACGLQSTCLCTLYSSHTGSHWQGPRSHIACHSKPHQRHKLWGIAYPVSRQLVAPRHKLQILHLQHWQACPAAVSPGESGSQGDSSAAVGPPADFASSGTQQHSRTDSSTLEEGSADQASSPGEADTEASTSGATAAGTPQSSSSLAKLWDFCRRLVSLLHELLDKLPSWLYNRRLKKLREAAEKEPGDAAKYATYLGELNHRNPEAVIHSVDAGNFSTNSAVVVEYVKALVSSNRIAQYAGEQAAALGDSHSSLPALLKDLQARAQGEVIAHGPGHSINRPLHVVLQEPRAAGGAAGAFLRSLLWSAVWLIMFSAFWLFGASIMRKYTATFAQNAAANSSTAMSPASGPSAIAPKEYNKENLPEHSVITFNDVKGCNEAKAELEEIVEYLRNPDRFTRLGAKLPKGVLLTGPPGTGKTLLARAIAGEAGVPFFYRAGSEFEEMFVGVGSRRVRSLFAAAKKKSPCIVFIDEIDAVGGSRKNYESHTRKTLNQLLVEMDGFEANEGIIVVAATNLAETLDPALTRPGRFDRHVAVPLPDVRGRLEILKHYLTNKPVGNDVDAELVARCTPGFSGADLANLVNEAALTAAKGSEDTISLAMLDEARDKVIMGTARKSMVQSDKERRLTAYHESGHALVALNTAGATPIHKATVVPRGHALGMVSQVPEMDQYSTSRQQLVAHIDVCMGGKVAEELIFGADHVTTGARSDLKSATRQARHMVTECGMSDAIGNIFLEADSTSPDTRHKVDAEVARILSDSFHRVTNLLRAKEKDLHVLAKALLEHETLTQTEIREVLAGTFQRKPVAPSSDFSDVKVLLSPGDIDAIAGMQLPQQEPVS